MKDRFGLYMPNANEIKSIWKNAVFIYDANMLLDLYRCSDLARNQLLQVLSGLSNKSWLPHQSLLEFANNRLTVIRDLELQYDQIIEAVEKRLNIGGLTVYIKQVESRHPVIQSTHIIDPIKKAWSEIKAKLDELKMSHPIIERDDRVQNSLRSMFHGKVGDPYLSARLDEIYSEAEMRYKAKVPPGFADAADKPSPQKYGDVVLWYQVIDYAKFQKKPVILVTGDRKEDWWLKNGPIRPELIEEFRSKTGMAFWAYKPMNFLGYAGEFLSLEVEQATAETNAIQNSRDREYRFYQEIRAVKREREVIAEQIREAQLQAKSSTEATGVTYSSTTGVTCSWGEYPFYSSPVRTYHFIPDDLDATLTPPGFENTEWTYHGKSIRNSKKDEKD